jgi:hypothetical protein
MKHSNFENFNSLLHTDWNPQKGDFVKENSLNDSAQFQDRMKKYNLLVGSLTALIVIVLITAIILFSI